MAENPLQRPRLLTTKAAAAQLGCHAETLRRAIRQGRLACYRMGGCTRIAPEHLQAYLDASECPVREASTLTSNAGAEDGLSSGGKAINAAEFQQERRMNRALNNSSRTSKPSLSVVP